MILAKIGDTLLKLDDLKAAEILLSIAAKAERLESTFDDNYNTYYHPATGQARITIEVTDATVVSAEEHRQKQAARAEKQRLAAEKAGATTTESN